MENRYRLLAILFLATLVSLLAWSYASGGIVAVLFGPGGDSQEKVEAVRAFLNQWRGSAPLAYVVMVTVEVVVAPIPGTLLYLPGGAIFGGFWGGLLSLLGNVLGAAISCQLMRSIAGRRATESFFESRSLARYRSLIERRGLLLIVLLRLNPLTSSDLVSYAAGLTTMRVTTVAGGTLLGMAPLCFAQSYLAETLFEEFPWLIWPLLVALAVYIVAVSVIIWRLRPVTAK